MFLYTPYGVSEAFFEYLPDCKPKETSPSTPTLPTPTPTDPINYTPPQATEPAPVHGFEPVEQSIDKVYYYHSDHLGSSTYVTDDNGRPVTYYDYLPFGEVAVEHNQTTNFNNGYKFNGKELDQATGMYYYGARYYDPRLSVFISVDPLAENYPNESPYIYTGNNPVNFVDPDGRCYTRASNGEYVPCAPPIKDVTFAAKLESSKPIFTYNYGAKQTDAFGNDWTFTKNNSWELVNANPNPDYSQKVAIAPTGDASYYEQRYKAHIESYGTTPPDYYLSYGHKYANKFTKELRNELSDAGKKWIDQTVTELQKQMENFIKNDSYIQSNNDAFRTKAFDTHVPSYIKGGLLKNLPFSDKFKIGTTPDLKDLTSPDGMRQVRQIIPKIF